MDRLSDELVRAKKTIAEINVSRPGELRESQAEIRGSIEGALRKELQQEYDKQLRDVVERTGSG